MSGRKRLAVAIVLAGGVFGLLTPAVLAGPSATASMRIANHSPGSAQPAVQHDSQTTHDDLCPLSWDLP